MPCRASLDIDHALAALEMKHIEAHLLARTEGLIDDLAVLDCERVMAVAFILKAVPLLAPLVLAVQQTCQCAGTSSACICHAMRHHNSSKQALTLSHRMSDRRTIDEISTATLELSQKVRDTDAALVWELAHVISSFANCLEDSLHTGLSLYEGK